MGDWQHMLARWVIAGLALLGFGVLSGALSTLVWRLRHRVEPEHLKVLLTVIALSPLLASALVILPAPGALCARQTMCYLQWMMQHLGTDSAPALRLTIAFTGVMMSLWLAGVLVRGMIAVQTLRRLYARSSPPSDRLRCVLQQMLPSEWQARFREVEMPATADGVYAGTCLLSHGTVQTLSEDQLRSVVAHEYQHLRAGDGWFALVLGILAGKGGWGVAQRHWAGSAELLADKRATGMGIPRTQLARALLQKQAQAQGVALGFGAEGSLLEDRLRLLLSPRNNADSGWQGVFWTWCGALFAGAVWVAYSLWSVAGASTCTVHCLVFH